MGSKGNLLEFKEFESRENSENGQESVYEQERELMEMKRDEICKKYLLFITFYFE